MINETDQLAPMDTCTDLYTPSSYSSIQATDIETKKLVVNAMNNAESLADYEGKTLNVIGVFTKPGIRRARAEQRRYRDTKATLDREVSLDFTAPQRGHVTTSGAVRPVWRTIPAISSAAAAIGASMAVVSASSSRSLKRSR